MKKFLELDAQGLDGLQTLQLHRLIKVLEGSVVQYDENHQGVLEGVCHTDKDNSIRFILDSEVITGEADGPMEINCCCLKLPIELLKTCPHLAFKYGFIVETPFFQHVETFRIEAIGRDEDDNDLHIGFNWDGSECLSTTTLEEVTISLEHLPKGAKVVTDE